MAESSVAKPSGRRRSGSGPVRSSAAANRGSARASQAAPSATSSSRLDDAPDHGGPSSTARPRREQGAVKRRLEPPRAAARSAGMTAPAAPHADPDARARRNLRVLGGGAGDPRQPDAGVLHPRRAGRADALADQVPRHAADLADRLRLDARRRRSLSNLMQKRGPDAGLRGRRRGRRAGRRALRLGAGRRAPFALFLVGSALLGALHVGAGFLPLRRHRRRERRLPAQGDLLGDGGGPRFGDRGAATGEVHRRCAGADSLRRGLCRGGGAQSSRCRRLPVSRQPAPEAAAGRQSPGAQPPGPDPRSAHRRGDDLRHGLLCADEPGDDLDAARHRRLRLRHRRRGGRGERACAGDVRAVVLHRAPDRALRRGADHRHRARDPRRGRGRGRSPGSS